MTLGVRLEAAAEGVKRRPKPHRGEDVEDGPLLGGRVADTVGRDDREPPVAREDDEAPRQQLALARQVALELDVDPVPAEEPGEPVEERARPSPVAAEDGRGERPVDAAGQADKPGGRPLEVPEGGSGLALRRSCLDAREEPAERPVPRARLDEQGEPARRCALPARPGAPHRRSGVFLHRQRRADQRPETQRPRRLVEAHDPVDSVHVTEAERLVAEASSLLGESLGRRRALEEAEGAPGSQLDVQGLRCQS